MRGGDQSQYKFPWCLRCASSNSRLQQQSSGDQDGLPSATHQNAPNFLFCDYNKCARFRTTSVAPHSVGDIWSLRNRADVIVVRFERRAQTFRSPKCCSVMHCASMWNAARAQAVHRQRSCEKWQKDTPSSPLRELANNEIGHYPQRVCFRWCCATT